jgi:hypothetical protein
MPTIPALTSFTANTQIKAAEVNSNFSSIRTTVNTYAALQDAAATISGAWTFSTAPVFSNAQTFAAGVTVTTGGVTVSGGGITVTGNSTITGTLGGLTGLTVASGGLTVTAGTSSFGADVGVTGTVTATTFSGSGASLTALPAANITGTLPAISGANLTSLNAANISSGTLPNARLNTNITGINSISLEGLNFPNTGTPYGTITAISGSSFVLTAADFGASWLTSSPPAASVTRYIKISLSSNTYLIKCESQV